MGIAHPAYDPQGVCSMQRIDVCWHRDVSFACHNSAQRSDRSLLQRSDRRASE